MRVTEAAFLPSEGAFPVCGVPLLLSETAFPVSKMLFRTTGMEWLVTETKIATCDTAYRLTETDKGRTDAPCTSVSIGFDMDDIGYGCKSRKDVIRVMG